MSTELDLRVRRSLTDLQDDYRNGKPEELENLMRAWQAISDPDLDPDDPNSFFRIGGYHGEPFRGAGWGDGTFWGGYCNHGNVLFPIWHRIYVLRLEDALRSVPGCENVTLPFWDECSEDSLTNGIPWALTDERFKFADGRTILNPLRSYTFPRNIVDHLAENELGTGNLMIYSKPAGYETVRYPYSGLVGSLKDRQRSAQHNATWAYPDAVDVLNENIKAWLNQKIVIRKQTISTGVHAAFVACLKAPNYTVFSNTTSAAAWGDNNPPEVPLESPHNKIHLAVGGYDVPKSAAPGQPDLSVIRGANGDMGENDTAGLDPIFFFHHCFIDRVFWLWQQAHGATDELPIIERYPGTNSADAQGATPGIPPNAWLSMDTPLEPFSLTDNGSSRAYIGRDGFNIETQLGYTYGPGSLEPDSRAPQQADPARSSSARADERRLHVAGIDRSRIHGSFLIDAFAEVDGQRTHLGSEAVLSRWHVGGCANCQTHLLAGASFPLHGLKPHHLAEDALKVEVRTRHGLLGDQAHSVTEGSVAEHPHFHIEVR